MCNMHYQRWRRHGTTARLDRSEYKPRARKPRPDPVPCAVDDCDRVADIPSRGWCRMHYLRWHRHGDPLARPARPPSYDSTHAKLRRDRGPAKDHPCAEGCGSQAEHWSYDGRDPDEKWTPWRDGSGRLMPYSTNLEHYHPVCVKCHYRINRERPSRDKDTA